MSITWGQYQAMVDQGKVNKPDEQIVHFEGLTFFLPEDQKELDEYVKKYYP